MAKAALTLIQPARSPERQRLADVILERDRRLALVESKRADKDSMMEQYQPLWSRRFALEDDLKGTHHRRTNETERLQALLSGETPPEVDPVEAMQAELAKVNAEVQRLRDQEATLDTDLLLLEGAHRMSVETVKEAVGAVIVSEAAPAAVVAEYHRLKERVRMLGRAIDGALDVRFANGGSSMMSHHVVRGLPDLPPCPWQAARDRLASDPDARLPMPEDVFAEPPPRSAA
ncbi:MAG: hypothetical protein K0Q54_3170 [Methylobacterium brachiatum]|jgi:hypothetical protein|nr:hypothetical protein [Methylobacterium brachiatum]